MGPTVTVVEPGSVEFREALLGGCAIDATGSALPEDPWKVPATA